MFFLSRSNRIEELFAALADELARPVADPLTPECVVVQSRGMATWLAMQLATRFGVWANPDFPHPRRFIRRLLTAALGREQLPVASFDRDLLTLAIMAALPRLLAAPEFLPLRRYLAAGDDWKTLQLAVKIADLFDQYAIFRPEMALAWEAGNDFGPDRHPLPAGERWQAELWRAIISSNVNDGESLHHRCTALISPARQMHEAWQRLHEGALAAPELLPPRIMLFAVTTLPPVYLNLLHEASRHTPVHLFLFSPAREYWADLYSPRAMTAFLARRGQSREAQEPLHLTAGHPLLTSLGTVGREFQDLLEESTDYQESGDFITAAAPPATTLARLQDDILQARPSGPPLRKDDSIVIHACHSPLREVEVLHDQLLAMLDGGDLEPRDIVVMTPDLETYGPLIEAVFQRPPSDPRYLPFRIADRGPLTESPLLDAFCQLFTLAESRLGLVKVLDFLACEPVRRRFGLDPARLERLTLWLEESRVRWGIDEEHRRYHQQPANRQNTWRFGLERLLLGYAMPGDGEHLFAGILPYDQIEGQDSETAASLLDFCEALFALSDACRKPRPLAAWGEIAAQALARFFSPGPEEEAQPRRLRDALAALLADAASVAFAQPLTAASFLALLRQRLEPNEGGPGFLEGGITFCAMLPMRTIPFPVVCLLGMSDNAFPRSEQPVGFDLIAAAPQPGDRNRRQEDRYLFLEAVLAARRRLYLSFVGRSLRDNKALPPSVVVDELLACLAADEGQKLVVEHPLQPFSPRYRDGRDPLLFTYAAEYSGTVSDHQASGHFGGEQPLETDHGADKIGDHRAPKPVALADLLRFFRNPAEWLARRQLGLVLPEPAAPGDQREPLLLNALEAHQLSDFILNRWEQGEAGQLLAIIRGQGVLPLAGAGEATWQSLRQRVQPLAACLAAKPGGEPLPALAFDLTLADGSRLLGELTGRVSGGLLRITPGRLHPPFLLACWLEHLAISALAPIDQEAGQESRTLMIGRGEQERADQRCYQPLAPAEARARLAELLALFRLGQTIALPFFPRASHEFVATLQRSREKSEEARRLAAYRQARQVFSGDGYRNTRPPEGDDPYQARLFSGLDPLTVSIDGLDFAAVSSLVYTPLLAALGKIAVEAGEEMP